VPAADLQKIMASYCHVYDNITWGPTANRLGSDSDPTLNIRVQTPDNTYQVFWVKPIEKPAKNPCQT